MIKIPQLNSIKWTSTTEKSGFESPRTSLFANQKRGVGQWHVNNGRKSVQVLAFNSTVSVQIHMDDSYVGASLSVVGDTAFISGTETTLADDYYQIDFNIEDLILDNGACLSFRLEVDYFDGEDFDTYTYNSEDIYILSYGEQNNFYDTPRSFGIAYKGDYGLFNGYYWGDEQILLMKDVDYVGYETETEKESSTSLRGEEEVLGVSNLKTFTYQFRQIPEYLYNIIIKAASLPTCYINGLAVTLSSIDEGQVYNGLKDFQLVVKERNYSGEYEVDDFKDYNIPDFSFEIWGENNIVSADDNGTVLSLTY